MKKFFCDKCGQEVKSHYLQKVMVVNDEHKKELCPQCIAQVMRVLNYNNSEIEKVTGVHVGG